jgi:putative membrane protein
MRTALVAATLIGVSPTLARAHASQELDHVARSWTWNPWLLTCFALSLGIFTRGYLRMHGRGATPTRGRRLQALTFGSSWLCILLALLSPLDGLSDLLFSAHMLQHELLMLVAAPLLVMARPLPVYLWALPTRIRLRLLGVLRRPALAAALRLFTLPAMALLVHAAARWLWHVPLLFEAALRNEWVHGVQHALFFATAVLFWWALVHGRYGRLGYGVAVVFVFATAMHTGALGALIALARLPWYPSYGTRAASLSIDVLADQRLAGLIMWVGAGVLFMLVGLALFAAWLGEAERRATRTTLATLMRTEHAAPRATLVPAPAHSDTALPADLHT